MINRRDVYACAGFADRVERWHAWPTLTRQTTGQHSCRMITIYVEIWGLPRAEVLYAMAVHDHGELLAGDMPWPGKMLTPGIRGELEAVERLGMERLRETTPSLTALERARVKVCDCLELWEHAQIECAMGNRLMECSWRDGGRAALEHAKRAAVEHSRDFPASVNHEMNDALMWMRLHPVFGGEWEESKFYDLSTEQFHVVRAREATE